jgi:hypothetical protein
MRKLYFVVIILISMTVAAFGQSREEYEEQSTRVELAKAVHIFPNPAIDFVHVRFDEIPARDITLTIHNIIGNPVPIETEVIDEFEVRVRVKDLNSGYYLLAVKDVKNHFQGTYKFLKR